MKKILIAVVFIGVFCIQLKSQTACENLCSSNYNQCLSNANWDRGICEDFCYSDYWDCRYQNPYSPPFEQYGPCRAEYDYCVYLCDYAWYWAVDDCDDEYYYCLQDC